jgi:hypothetical protein
MARKAQDTKKSTPRKASSTRKESYSPKPQKSIFRVDTLVTVLVLAALIGFAFYLNREKKNANAEATPTGEAVTFVFNETNGIANSIEVKPATGETVRVVRDEKNVWALELPIKTEANQSESEAAASQISALVVTGSIPADADPSIFGFDAPAFMITVGFADGTTHTLEIGDVTPTQNGYYVRLDKGSMMIVGMSGIEALVQLTSFPPYLNTPTPTPLPPTETPVPPTETAPTPDLSVTPTP